MNSTARWAIHKRIIRKAALAARNHTSDTAAASAPVRRSRLASIARAFSFQDTKLAARLQEVCAEARRHLSTAQGKVRLILPNQYTLEFEHVMQEILHENPTESEPPAPWANSADSAPPAPKAAAKLSKNARAHKARTAASWSPFGKRVRLAGILLPASETSIQARVEASLLMSPARPAGSCVCSSSS
jgi:hypothetical protein